MTKARPPLWRSLRQMARCAVPMLLCFTNGAVSQTIIDATYSTPTDRYAHGILGDAIEWAALEITVENRGNTLTDAAVQKDTYVIHLPLDRVFEDVSPRLFDVDGDGGPEVIVVETQVSQGAQLAIYDQTGKIAATPHIGTRNRWLSPVGAADFDGDGAVEIAYIDRPHLNKVLRIWRYVEGTLEPVADIPGQTNHRIGERDIGGGVRNCGNGSEMIAASANWREVIATRFENEDWVSRRLGPYQGRESFAEAMSCP